MDMVILIIETTKRSRCEEVSKGQLKWAVSKPKMNVKATSPQLDEGDKSKGRLGGGGKSRVWAKARHHASLRPTRLRPNRRLRLQVDLVIQQALSFTV